MDVIERARRYVAKCPGAISGQGGHNTTFHVAAVLVHGFALSEQDALRLLKEWNGCCQPAWSEGELVHKVTSAANAQHSEQRGYLLKNGETPHPASGPGAEKGRVQAWPVKKPEFKPMVLKRVAAQVREVEDIFEFVRDRSPVPVDGETSSSVLRRLYPPGSGEKVLIFSDMRSQGQMVWEADGLGNLDEGLPAGPEGVWFLPQPVTGEFSLNPRLQKMSRRSEEAVTAWRYMVLESDEADADDWLRCLVQLPLRIVSICESGGRSIHALVRLDAESKGDWDAKVAKMKPVLVTLGADANALSAVRLTRLPQATRGSRVQRLLYLNPGSDGVPIRCTTIRKELCERATE